MTIELTERMLKRMAFWIVVYAFAVGCSLDGMSDTGVSLLIRNVFLICFLINVYGLVDAYRAFHKTCRLHRLLMQRKAVLDELNASLKGESRGRE